MSSSPENPAGYNREDSRILLGAKGDEPWQMEVEPTKVDHRILDKQLEAIETGRAPDFVSMLDFIGEHSSADPTATIAEDEATVHLYDQEIETSPLSAAILVSYVGEGDIKPEKTTEELQVPADLNHFGVQQGSYERAELPETPYTVPLHTAPIKNQRGETVPALMAGKEDGPQYKICGLGPEYNTVQDSLWRGEAEEMLENPEKPSPKRIRKLSQDTDAKADATTLAGRIIDQEDFGIYLDVDEDVQSSPNPEPSPWLSYGDEAVEATRGTVASAYHHSEQDLDLGVTEDAGNYVFRILDGHDDPAYL